MFKDNRVYYASLGLALVAALLILHAVRSFDSYQVTHANERQCDAEYRTADAGQQIKAECAEIAARVAAHGVSDSNRAANRDQAPDYGLKAQQDMAEWAYAAQWAAVIGSIITGVGVIYVALTLYETRNATAAADRAATAALDANKGFIKASRQQLSAYVVGENPQVLQTFKQKDPTTYSLRFQIKLKNTGQTPAYQVFNICRVVWDTAEGFTKWVVEAEPTSRTIVGPGGEVFAIEVLKNPKGEAMEFTNGLVEGLVAANATIWLKGHLVYRDIDGRLWRHDYSWRLLEPKKLLEPPEVIDGKWKRREIGMFANATGNDLRVIEDPSEKS